MNNTKEIKNQFQMSQDYNQKVTQNSSINMNMFKSKVKKQIVTSNTNNGLNNLYGNYKKILGPSNLSVTNIIGEKRFDEINNFGQYNPKMLTNNAISNNKMSVSNSNNLGSGKNN
jgi:hypothetical protein